MLKQFALLTRRQNFEATLGTDLKLTLSIGPHVKFDACASKFDAALVETRLVYLSQSHNKRAERNSSRATETLVTPPLVEMRFVPRRDKCRDFSLP